MEIISIILGLIITIIGLVLILLRFRCYDMEMMSWFMFIGGIIITIVGYISPPLSELGV